MGPTDYWRSIILYGRNVATYKIALGQVLLDVAAGGHSTISMPNLAVAFFRCYRERLQAGQAQQYIPGRKTLLERVVKSYDLGELSESQAAEVVERAGFNDVVPRFHTVGDSPIVQPFYVQTQMGLTLTDALATVVQGSSLAELRDELSSRWSLLETAFAPDYDPAGLGTDGSTIYQARYLERVSITSVRPVIGGYQNGLCFYCGEPLGNEPIHVDHLLPRAYVQHDEIWNLVLAHESCNLQKHASLPPLEFIIALRRRNEYYIASNHPIKQHLMSAMGKSVRARRDFLQARFSEAQQVVRHQWRPKMIVTLPDPLTPLQLIAE